MRQSPSHEAVQGNQILTESDRHRRRCPHCPAWPMPPSSLSLKQRLAALSLASSAPSSPISATSPVKSPRKFSFAPPWTRRQPEQSFAGQAVQSRDVVQDVMGKMLFQAGVDFECVHYCS